MSDQTTSAAVPAVASTESSQAMDAHGSHRTKTGTTTWLAEAGFFRMLGLIIALALLCIVGAVTAGDRFVDSDNLLTILRLSTVIGV